MSISGESIRCLATAVLRAGLFLVHGFWFVLSGCSNSSDPALQQPLPPVPPPVLLASIGNASISEGDAGTTELTFVVSVSATSSDTITLDYATSDGTAISGSDYQASNGTVTFNPGETSLLLPVVVIGDTDNEPDESFSVTLSNATNVTIATATATGTIFDDDGNTQSGLDQRPSNTTCIAPDRPTAASTIVTQDAFPNLANFGQLLALVQALGDNTQFYAVEQPGRVHRFANSPNVSTSTVFVDISGRVDNGPSEAGLLGIAFHPDFQNNGQVFLSYTASGLTSRISRFRSPDGGVTLDPNSEQVLLSIGQPAGNHNGGGIAFGADGLLYIGFGDGGGAGDTANNAQNTGNLLGTMLRIDVNNAPQGQNYGIPADNPFASSSCVAGACPEIYAWGLRNPWRWSFDRSTGGLWLGDVGQGTIEEIDRIERGGNYGWRCYEGSQSFNLGGCGAENEYVFPVAEYDHGLGNSVTGGYVYRGTSIPNLVGTYLYGDFGSGRIWGFSLGSPGSTATELLTTSFNISSFAEDNDGELYVLDYSGRIHRVVEGSSSGVNTIPDLLSATGCVLANDPTQPESGLVGYTINAPFWSDGADKQRWIAMPDGLGIDIATDGDFTLPVGSVVMKNFEAAGRLIETRLLMRHPDGEWAGYTYEWNATETEATRVIGGKSSDIGGQTWVFPSEADCMRCHTTAAGRTLGLETAQLNRDFTYPQTGRTANQLTTLESIAFFNAPLPDTPNNLPAYAHPEDQAETLDARSRSYFHTNCSQCHRPNGPTNVDMDLRHDTPLSQVNVCNVLPDGVDLGIANAVRLALGDPARSLILQRTVRRDVHGMPPLATDLADTNGTTLLQNWIATLTICQ